MTRYTFVRLLMLVLMSGSANATEDTLFERAEKGEASAQFKLGFMYDTGDGVTKDSTEAIKWYRKSAEQGYARAQYNLGVIYNYGNGVPKDSAEAVKWYLKAAEQGNAYAQTNLGLMYDNGDGVPKDEIEALAWFNIAAASGEDEQQDSKLRGDEQKAQEQVEEFNKQGQVLVDEYKEFIEQSKNTALTPEARTKAETDAQKKLEDIQRKQADVQNFHKKKLSPAVANRGILEQRLGREMTLAAQQRSKQIQKEIEAAKRAPTSSATKDSGGPISPLTETPKASGSGAIVSAEGHVLTAAHVVAGASRVRIFTTQGMKAAKVLRIDEANDLAVLKLEEGTYPALPVAPSRKIRLGQTVATIGFPNVDIQGFSPKVTRGEISSLNGIGDDPRAWQISVPVQTGNSGGPLLDENGNLIGVVVSKLGLKAAAVTGDLPQNVNYAVKAAYALALLEPYLSNDTSEPNQGTSKPRFEDMIAKAQESVVLILVY